MRVATLRHEFVSKCLRAYEPNGPFIYKEFVKDVQKIMFLAKYFKQCKKKSADAFRPRVLVNYYIGVKNSFGSKANELLFEQSDEFVYPEILAMLSFMKEIPADGIMPFSFKAVSLELYGTNSDLLREFYETDE